MFKLTEHEGYIHKFYPSIHATVKFHCLGGGGVDSGPQRNAQVGQQKAVEAATGRINAAFAGFNPNFYAKQYKTLLDSQLPAEQQQFAQTKDQLGFKLANQGLGKSSQAKKLGESLAAQEDVAKQTIANAAQGGVNSLRQNIEQSRSNLIGEASVANQPGIVAGQALNTAAGFSGPSVMAPLGQLFAGWANTYLQGSNNNSVNNTISALSGALSGGSRGGSGYGSSFGSPITVVN